LKWFIVLHSTVPYVAERCMVATAPGKYWSWCI